MALIACPECSAEISSRSRACPVCGARRRRPWPWILTAIFLAVAAFTAAGVYAGHQQTVLMKQEVERRLAGQDIRSIALARARRDQDLEFLCGMAVVRDENGVEDRILFAVVFTGVFPSVVGTFLGTDSEFNYSRACGPPD